MGVVKLADYQPQREVLESKVASLDDGYMRIATSIGKLKPKLKLAGREHQAGRVRVIFIRCADHPALRTLGVLITQCHAGLL